MRLDCDRPEPLWLEAQSVPSASLVPCVRELPGWSLAGANARDGWSEITLNHDRAGEHAMVVRLTATCDPAGATELPSRHPGVRHYQRTECLAGGFNATWHAGSPVVLGFVPRQALRQVLDDRSGGRLHLDPVPPDSS